MEIKHLPRTRSIERQTWTPSQSQNPGSGICPTHKMCWAMVTQNLWEWLTNVLFNLRPMTREGSIEQYCLHGQELGRLESSDLGHKQILLAKKNIEMIPIVAY